MHDMKNRKTQKLMQFFPNTALSMTHLIEEMKLLHLVVVGPWQCDAFATDSLIQFSTIMKKGTVTRYVFKQGERQTRGSGCIPKGGFGDLLFIRIGQHRLHLLVLSNLHVQQTRVPA
jgi:hypothetical protein